MEYSYPMDSDWTVEEMSDVIHFFTAIEQAYETKVSLAELKTKYEAFKRVVPSKSEEKQLSNSFASISGYSIYHVMKAAKTAKTREFKMKQ